MIEYIKGNVLDIKEGVLCQHVECQGITLTKESQKICKLYPQVKVDCDDLRNQTTTFSDLLGKVCWTHLNDLHIASIFAQDRYQEGVKCTNYLGFYEGLYTVVKWSLEHNSMPVYVSKELGCDSLTGGDWKQVGSFVEALATLLCPDSHIIVVEE